MVLKNAEMNGINKDEIHREIQEQMGYTKEKEFVFNDKLIIKFLNMLESENKLRKSSDKKVFPVFILP